MYEAKQNCGCYLKGLCNGAFLGVLIALPPESNFFLSLFWYLFTVEFLKSHAPKGSDDLHIPPISFYGKKAHKIYLKAHQLRLD